MLSDPFPQAIDTPPSELGGTTAGIFMYVEDVDAVVKKAVDEGATVTRRSKTSSGATASERSRIRSATSGRSGRTSRTFRRRRWRSARKRQWPQWRAEGRPTNAVKRGAERGIRSPSETGTRDPEPR